MVRAPSIVCLRFTFKLRFHTPYEIIHVTYVHNARRADRDIAPLICELLKEAKE